MLNFALVWIACPQVKCVKELKSRNQTPEPIEKGLIRAKYDLPVFRDGTVRFDMSDVPVTHFTPEEIDVDWKRLHALGYTHDWEGKPLESDDQMLELFPQAVSYTHLTLPTIE